MGIPGHVKLWVDPSVLMEHLPPYTEIDLFEGKALVSVVGFLFITQK